jgi:hypothetical protein
VLLGLGLGRRRVDISGLLGGRIDTSGLLGGRVDASRLSLLRRSHGLGVLRRRVLASRLGVLRRRILAGRLSLLGGSRLGLLRRGILASGLGLFRRSRLCLLGRRVFTSGLGLLRRGRLGLLGGRILSSRLSLLRRSHWLGVLRRRVLASRLGVDRRGRIGTTVAGLSSLGRRVLVGGLGGLLDGGRRVGTVSRRRGSILGIRDSGILLLSGNRVVPLVGHLDSGSISQANGRTENNETSHLDRFV